MDVNKGQWRKSSYSSDKGDDCVEVAGMTSSIAIRDSKDPDGGVVCAERSEFHELVRCIKEAKRA
ncbi:DUF397 domain-containing protein [Spirillospora sp. NPDC052269]